MAAGGCSDSSTGPGDGGGYPDQSTPNRVVEKLEAAYENLDTGAYMECLAADFVFFLDPDDVAADPALPEYWGRVEEQLLHAHMFADTSEIENIFLTLTVVSTDSLPGEDAEDPADDLWEYEVDVDLVVQTGVNYLSSGTSLFVMRRSPDRNDAVWQIVEHHDLGGGGIRGEDTTWTAIKLAFGGSGADAIYPVRADPEKLLRKLELACVRMDCEAFLDCLAEDFCFFVNPEDQYTWPDMPESWDRAVEEQIHRAMFGEDPPEDPNLVVERIRLTFAHDDAECDEGDPGDPLDDVWTCREDYDLRVDMPWDLVLHADKQCDFVIEVDPDETGHGGEPLWEITSWHDIPDWTGRGPAPGREDTSWTGIKWVYHEE
jgi:hypothetical protein